jgi:cytochrome c oxidase subunit I+III
MSDKPARRVLDLSALPSVAFGRTNVSWLGNVLYMTIEGAMFAMVIATYFYLRTRTTQWPPGGQAPPALRYGLANLVIFVVSLAPAYWVKHQAFRRMKQRVQMGLCVLAGFGLVAMFIRTLEFTTLNCRWSDNAYASCLWIVLGLHTGHLITEWIETLAVTAISFTDRMEGIRFADVGMNTDYWYFVVVTGVVVDVIVYLTPRWI